VVQAYYHAFINLVAPFVTFAAKHLPSHAYEKSFITHATEAKGFLGIALNSKQVDEQFRRIQEHVDWFSQQPLFQRLIRVLADHFYKVRNLDGSSIHAILNREYEARQTSHASPL
jgi:hypothetical protein